MEDAPILILAGPTAVGKTGISLRLAERQAAEIISADSRQVYRNLDIGTAKPSPEERRRVPHHFVDELDLETPFSAGQFAEAAYERIRAIQSRSRTPLVVGGSTLYLYALQFGLADIPMVDRAVRRELEHRLEREGAQALYRELRDVDPAAADTMDATKTQRLIRALEVFHGTGRPLSYYQEHTPTPPFSFRTLVLHRERAELYDRINQRVDQMLEAGLLDEVAALLEEGYSPDLNPLRTIGYQEPIRYLKGELSRTEMIRLIKRNTRRYAKRQLTWFRRFDELQWVSAEGFSVDDVILQ